MPKYLKEEWAFFLDDRGRKGVDLLPSNIELSGMEVGLFNVMSREYVLRKLASVFIEEYGKRRSPHRRANSYPMAELIN